MQLQTEVKKTEEAKKSNHRPFLQCKSMVYTNAYAYI